MNLKQRLWEAICLLAFSERFTETAVCPEDSFVPVFHIRIASSIMVSLFLLLRSSSWAPFQGYPRTSELVLIRREARGGGTKSQMMMETRGGNSPTAACLIRVSFSFIGLLRGQFYSNTDGHARGLSLGSPRSWPRDQAL